MKKFERAIIPQSEIVKAAKDFAAQWRAGEPAIRAAMPEATAENIDTVALQTITKINKNANEEVWLNDKYQVALRRLVPEVMIHLSIKRLDRQPIHDWRELQEIKNQLVGPECEGVELYPAESRVVDTANQFHLWVCPKVGEKFPFGFDEGRIVSNGSVAGSVQRPL
jgi:hypothetical protein